MDNSLNNGDEHELEEDEVQGRAFPCNTQRGTLSGCAATANWLLTGTAALTELPVATSGLARCALLTGSVSMRSDDAARP